MPDFVYERRRPEQTTLHRLVRENLETLYAAVDAGEGAALPAFVRGELEGYLDCGLLCRGFAQLKCEGCGERRLVAFSCKGRGFCPACMGRRMCQTAANLIERTLPRAPLRQWVLTVPFELRHRLAYDGALLGAVSRIFIDTLLGFYQRKLAARGKGGALVVVQRTSSDLKLNPHYHAVCLDGVFVEEEGALAFRALPHLQTREVCDVLHTACVRIVRHLVRRGVLTRDSELVPDETLCEREPALAELARAAVSGLPPCGPELRRGRDPIALRLSLPQIAGPLSVKEAGFTLHAATHAAESDAQGREALLRYVLRPPVAQQRITEGPEGLVRIALKKPFSDGTFAIDMDPLSLLSRLAAAVPPPRLHTVRYSGVLASASAWRSRIVPVREPEPDGHACGDQQHEPPRRPRSYRPWAELLRRTFELDVLSCPSCGGRMKLVSLVNEPRSLARFLRHLGEPTEPPPRQPAREPPYWQSRVLRRRFVSSDQTTFAA